MSGARDDGSVDGAMTAPGAPSSDEARLACAGITVYFGGLAAVKGVDLAVPPAAIVGLVGPNGAGKSTLFAVLSGLLRPSRGTVLLDGEDVTRARPQRDLTVRDHLVIAYRVKHARQRVWSDLFTMGSLRPAEPDERRHVGELIDLLGLGQVVDRPALGMPPGLARTLELGRALAAAPTVLLLDEPSCGLNSSETEQFETTLRRVSAERAISVLLVEHDVDLVMRLCSTVSVLDFGELIASGAPAEVRASPAVRAAYLGEDLDNGEARASGSAVEVPVMAQISAGARRSGPLRRALRRRDGVAGARRGGPVRVLWRGARAHGGIVQHRRGQGAGRPRRQRFGQEHAGPRHLGVGATGRRSDRLRRCGDRRLACSSHPQGGTRVPAREPGCVSDPDGDGEPPHGGRRSRRPPSTS